MNEIAFNAKDAFSNNKIDRKSEIIDTLKRKNLYWISQVSGWSLFVIVNLLIISTFQAIHIKCEMKTYGKLIHIYWELKLDISYNYC